MSLVLNMALKNTKHQNNDERQRSTGSGRKKYTSAHSISDLCFRSQKAKFQNKSNMKSNHSDISISHPSSIKEEPPNPNEIDYEKEYDAILMEVEQLQHQICYSAHINEAQPPQNNNDSQNSISNTQQAKTKKPSLDDFDEEDSLFNILKEKKLKSKEIIIEDEESKIFTSPEHQRPKKMLSVKSKSGLQDSIKKQKFDSNTEIVSLRNSSEKRRSASQTGKEREPYFQRQKSKMSNRENSKNASLEIELSRVSPEDEKQNFFKESFSSNSTPSKKGLFQKLFGWIRGRKRENTYLDRTVTEVKAKKSKFAGFSSLQKRQYARKLWKKAALMMKVISIFNKVRDEIHTYGAGPNIAKNSKEEKTVIPSCIILPDCRFKITWNIIMIFLLLYTAIYLPFKTAFIEDEPSAFAILDIIIDSLFATDILITFFSGFHDEDNKLITNRCVIAKGYLKSWFVLDIFACFPFQYLEGMTDSSSGDYNQLLRLLRLPRIYRLIRILRLVKMVRLVKYNAMFNKIIFQLKMHAGITRLIKSIITIFFFVHFFACVWYFIARNGNFEPDSWVSRLGLIDSSNSEKYVAAIYWVFQTLTTVGFGDVPACTMSERLLALILMFFGVGFYSFTIGNLSSILSNIDSRAQRLATKLMSMNEFASKAKLPDEIQQRIKKSLERNHNSLQFDQEEFLDELPASLKGEIITFTHEKIFRNIQFFKDKDPNFIMAILPFLKNIKFEGNEVLYRENDIADEVFFILEGRAKMVTSNGYLFRTYVEGSYFGEIEIFTKKDFRDYTVIVDQNCELLSIKKFDFLSILQDYPNIKKSLKDVAEKRRRRNLEAINIATKGKIFLDKKKMLTLRNTKKTIFNKHFLKRSNQFNLLATSNPQNPFLIKSKSLIKKLHHPPDNTKKSDQLINHSNKKQENILPNQVQEKQINNQTIESSKVVASEREVIKPTLSTKPTNTLSKIFQNKIPTFSFSLVERRNSVRSAMVEKKDSKDLLAPHPSIETKSMSPIVDSNNEQDREHSLIKRKFSKLSQKSQSKISLFNQNKKEFLEQKNSMESELTNKNIYDIAEILEDFVMQFSILNQELQNFSMDNEESLKLIEYLIIQSLEKNEKFYQKIENKILKKTSKGKISWMK